MGADEQAALAACEKAKECMGDCACRAGPLLLLSALSRTHVGMGWLHTLAQLYSIPASLQTLGAAAFAARVVSAAANIASQMPLWRHKRADHVRQFPDTRCTRRRESRLRLAFARRPAACVCGRLNVRGELVFSITSSRHGARRPHSNRRKKPPLMSLSIKLFQVSTSMVWATNQRPGH